MDAANASGGAGGQAASVPMDACGDVVARGFVPACGSSACHGATATQQGLDLVSPGVAARVVGISGTVCASVLADPNPSSATQARRV